MNYYQPRKRKKKKDGKPIWCWTVRNDNEVWHCGACADGKCEHTSADEAREHESARIRELIKTGKRTEIDTKHGRACHAPDCKEKAFHYVTVESWPITACEAHLDDPSWYRANDQASSW